MGKSTVSMAIFYGIRWDSPTEAAHVWRHQLRPAAGAPAHHHPKGFLVPQRQMANGMPGGVCLHDYIGQEISTRLASQDVNHVKCSHRMSCVHRIMIFFKGYNSPKRMIRTV